MGFRFQADADLNQALVQAVLRLEPGIDFRTAIAAGLTGMADPQVLALCARDGRVLVTHDARTMPLHFAEFLGDATSPGVLIVPQHFAISKAAEEIVLIASATEPEEWVDRICRLPL